MRKYQTRLFYCGKQHRKLWISTQKITFFYKTLGDPSWQRGLKSLNQVQNLPDFFVTAFLSVPPNVNPSRDKHSLVNSPKAATLRKGTFLRVTCTPSILLLLIFVFGWTWKCSNWKLENWVPGCSFVRFIAFSLDVGWLSFELQEHGPASGCMDLMVCSISQLPVLLTLGWFISKTNFLFDHNSQFKGLTNKIWSKQQQDRISALQNLFNKFWLQMDLSFQQ